MRLSPRPGVLHSIGLANGFRFRGRLHQFNGPLKSWSEACSRSSAEPLVDRFGGLVVAVGNQGLEPAFIGPSCRWLVVEKVKKEMPTTGNPARPKATKPRTFWLSFGVFLVTVVVAVGVLFSPLWNTIAVEPVRCVVVSAEPRTASGGLRGSVSTPAVVILTENCGPLGISRGVTSDEQEELASSFQVGAEYEFDIGWYGRVIMKHVLRGAPEVQGYRLVE